MNRRSFSLILGAVLVQGLPHTSLHAAEKIDFGSPPAHDFRAAIGKIAIPPTAVPTLFEVLGAALTRFAPGEKFRIIVAIKEGVATARFHKLRSGEQWLAEDLESYQHEAIAFDDIG